MRGKGTAPGCAAASSGTRESDLRCRSWYQTRARCVTPPIAVREIALRDAHRAGDARHVVAGSVGCVLHDAAEVAHDQRRGARTILERHREEPARGNSPEIHDPLDQTIVEIVRARERAGRHVADAP